MKEHIASIEDKPPPLAETYCTNKHVGNVILTADEWETAKVNSRKYANMLGLRL